MPTLNAGQSARPLKEAEEEASCRFFTCSTANSSCLVRSCSWITSSELLACGDALRILAAFAARSRPVGSKPLPSYELPPPPPFLPSPPPVLSRPAAWSAASPGLLGFGGPNQPPKFMASLYLTHLRWFPGPLGKTRLENINRRGNGELERRFS